MMMLYGSLCHAIVCKHIVERSETNTRKVYQIQRDALGYMWFMNHAGISRFDGTKLKHYKLPAEGRTMDYYMGNCRLLTDNRNGLWVVTRNGYLWMYNPSLDKFECMSIITLNFFKESSESKKTCFISRLYNIHLYRVQSTFLPSAPLLANCSSHWRSAALRSRFFCLFEVAVRLCRLKNR